MDKISISTFAKWERTVNIFGIHDSPLRLLVRLQNLTNERVEIINICISVKRSFLFFNISKDMFSSNKTWNINANKNFEVSFDISEIARIYGVNKKFSVKVYYDNSIIESDIFTVEHLHSHVI